MRTALPFLVLALGGCGGESGPTHWKDQPLETVEGVRDGVGYTIQLPKGMKKDSADYSDGYNYHQNGYTFAPRIAVTKASAPRTLEAALAEEDEPVLDKIATPEGWVYLTRNAAYKDDPDFLLEGQVGDFNCTGRLYPMRKRGEGEKEVQALWPKVAAMCLSIKKK
jgi:hypothetical protein